MIICIEIPEHEYKVMSAEERLRMLHEGYARTKAMQLQAQNYHERLELLNIPREKAHAVLTERQEKVLAAYEYGLLT